MQIHQSAEDYLETILMPVSYTHLDVYKRQVLEIGWQQREAVTALLAANGWADIECRKDFGGNDRCMIARRPG